MNRFEILARYATLVQELGARPCDVVVGAGAALVLFGIREDTSDLDVSIHEELFRELGETRPRHFFGKDEVVEWGEGIDLHSFSEHPPTVFVDGVCCLAPAALLRFKERLAEMPERPKVKREQDIADIVRLIEYTA